MLNVGLFIAFAAGVVSFLAPCILPLIPGYISFLAGSRIDKPVSRTQTFLTSLFFVLGFSLVFAILGVALNTVLSKIAYDVQIWLSRVGGLIIIFFGFYLTGLIKIPFLETEHKIKLNFNLSSRYLTSFLFGAAFAAGWTPCVGAALGAILALAATKPTQAFILLMSYSFGLGLPFIIVGIFTNEVTAIISKVGPVLKYINLIFGIILIIFGVLVFTQTLNLIANFSLLQMVLSRMPSK